MNRFGAFRGLTLVEVGGAAAGAYCGKLFADLGASRTVIGHGPPGPGAGFYGSRPSTAGPMSETGSGGPAGEAELLSSADVVIQSSANDPISRPLEPSNESQIVIRISPFADSGPYREWRSTDLVDAAIAGHLRLTGDPEREPLQGVPDLVHHAAGVTAFVAAVAALIARARTGMGQLVEVSHQEVIVALHQFTLCRYTHNGAVLNRLGNRYAGPGSPIGAYQCADGWIGLALPQEDQLERMLEVTGLITMLERPDIDSMWDLMTVPGLLDDELVPYLRTQDRNETVELFQALRLPCAPVVDLDEVLNDPHLQERDFWRPAPDGSITIPGPPFRMSNHDWSLGGDSKGSDSNTDPDGGVSKGSDSNTDPDGGVSKSSDSNTDPKEQTDEPVAALGDGPLTGLRVLDMTRVWAGPLATRILADLGAEVLMAEVPWTRTPQEVPQTYVDGTHFFPDDQAGERPWNRSAFHNKYAINKLSTVIELDKADGLALFKSLVGTVDVLVENYSPRVMPGFGLDDQALQELNPDLVYVTMPGYGRSGPHSDWVAYGPTIDGHVGHTSLTGYDGEGPWKCGIAWPDPIGGLHGAAAALVALLDRLVAPSGGGQTVEVAQIESAINMIGQHVVAAQLGHGPDRTGNRRPGRAPQGVYPCAGEDRWIAISVIDAASWHGLCRVLDMADLADLDAHQRQQQHDLIDRRIAELTEQRIDVELMWQLQAAGVPAGAVTDAADVMADPNLTAADFFVPLDHPDAGSHRWPRFPARLHATPATMRQAAATMGQHNDRAVLELAGYDRDAYGQLRQDGVVRIDPPA